MVRKSGLLAGVCGLVVSIAGSSIAAEAPAPVAPVKIHPDRWPKTRGARLIDPKIEAKIDAVMAKMTLEEKVGQTIQADTAFIKPEDLKTYPLGSILAGGNSDPGGDPRAPAKAWLQEVQDFWEASATGPKGEPRIPIIFGIDAVHGHSNVVGATLFPHNVGLGATHDPALLRQIGRATAEEISVTGIDWTFAPTVAVSRDERWGRAYESYSEDPKLVGLYSKAMVEGIQGPLGGEKGLGQGATISSVKHFLGDGGTTKGRDQGDTAATEDELIHIHAAGFKPAIDAGVLTVMVSFSSVNGVKITGSHDLITGALKEGLGFDGFAVGDWDAHAQVPGCTNESCPAAMNAGLDMFMAPDGWKNLYLNTLKQVKDGTIPQARLDDAVRRILRVKFKAGVFNRIAPKDRPLAGKFDILGSPAHREIARKAVRESLVLLKNDGVLPLKASAHILVAGDGADNISKQSGGWTITWQGTSLTNADFPGAHSIYAGVKEAVAHSGGAAELAPDGHFTQKPDVAIVVFGENPYAEFQGDIDTLNYGKTQDLELIKRFKAQGIKVVAVFITGRPLYVNPYVNAADAFVVAWLPGTEGEGVSDVLIGDRKGKPWHDFHGKLPFSWPGRPDQFRVNIGDADYHPQFAYGYGLTYESPKAFKPLVEAKVDASAGDPNVLFSAGKPQGGLEFVLSDAGGVTKTAKDGVSPGKAVSVHAVDAGAQESGRQVAFAGTGEASLSLAGPARDWARQSNGDMVIRLSVRIDAAPTAPLLLSAGDAAGKRGVLDVSQLIGAAPVGQWKTYKVKLSCFAAKGVDMEHLTEPFRLSTAGAATLSFGELRLDSNTGDGVCPQ